MTDAYGYDVQCRIVGSHGIAALPEVPSPKIRVNGAIQHHIFMDWQTRFIDAYDVELQRFLDIVNGRKNYTEQIASAWDGYVAEITSDACVEALHQPGVTLPINVPERPALYK